jgi:Icc protein
MPIYLPPISRRKFLARSMIAGAAAALQPALFAARRPADENAWALFSDLHLAADRGRIARGINMADHFTKVCREVLALPKRPAGVIVNGDCAFNSGEAADYGVLADLLEPLRADRMPIHLALGNHDNRERFWEAWRGENPAARPVPERQVALIRTARVNWFILDSLEKTLSTPGLLGPEQLTWLAKALDENRRKPAIIMVHHNPGLPQIVGGLKDTEAFYEVIRPRKQVKAYIYGHTHFWKIDEDVSGIHLINLPPVAYVFQEGQPAGWVQACLERSSMKLEFHSLDTSHKAHGQVVDLKWRKG